MTKIQEDIAVRSEMILGTPSPITRYSAKVESSKDPKTAFETVSSLFDNDRQTRQSLEAKVKLLSRQLTEEPQVKERLDLIQSEINKVEKKFNAPNFPDLPQPIS